MNSPGSTASIAAVSHHSLNRWALCELVGVALLGNAPGGAAIVGRHEIIALEHSRSAINRAFAPAGNTASAASAARRNATRSAGASGPARREINMSGSASSKIGNGDSLAQVRPLRNAGNLFDATHSWGRPRTAFFSRGIYCRPLPQSFQGFGYGPTSFDAE
jgi:hypothetical protein